MLISAKDWLETEARNYTGGQLGNVEIITGAINSAATLNQDQIAFASDLLKDIINDPKTSRLDMMVFVTFLNSCRG